MKLGAAAPSHVTAADLVSYGWVGLVEAFDRARPGMRRGGVRGVRALPVRGAALDHLRRARSGVALGAGALAEGRAGDGEPDDKEQRRPRKKTKSRRSSR